MAYKLFDALNRAAKAFRGAPDPAESRGISPQMQSNLDRRAASVRFQAGRRMQGRPGFTGPFGITTGAVAPISPQMAATWVSGRLGTEYAPELNRMTAPDPMSFARGSRAPEFIGQELGLGAQDIESARLANVGKGIDIDYQPRQLDLALRTGEQGLTEGEQRLAEAEAMEAQRAKLRPSELEVAEQAPELGRLGIEREQQALAGAPTPEELREQKGLETETAKQNRLIQRIDQEIETARIEGDYEKADRLQRDARDIVTGFTGPRAPEGTPAPGGAPPISTGISPIQLERNKAMATGITQSGGVEGAIAMLTDVASDTGWANKGSEQKLELALSTIQTAIDSADNRGSYPTVRDIIKAEIKNTEGYLAVKQRALQSDAASKRGWGTLQHPISSFALPFTTAPLKQINRMRDTAEKIVHVVEGSPTGGAPPIR